MLGGPGFLDKAHAAVDLHPKGGNLHTGVGTIALDDRRKEVDPGMGGGPDSRVWMTFGPIQVTRCEVGERPDRLHPRPHAHQHPADIGMPDDRHSRRFGLG